MSETLRKYVHVQDEAASEWYIEHNLGTYTVVTALDGEGQQFWPPPDVHHDSPSVTRLDFGGARRSGRAVLVG